jgi:hypothetical protein
MRSRRATFSVVTAIALWRFRPNIGSTTAKMMAVATMTTRRVVFDFAMRIYFWAWARWVWKISENPK